MDNSSFGQWGEGSHLEEFNFELWFEILIEVSQKKGGVLKFH